ncbi:MAG: sensor histidine kinase [Nocardioides sp.]
MHPRAILRKYGDLLLAVVLALFLTVETVAFGGSLSAVGAALLGGLSLSLRRRLPAASFLLSMVGLFGLVALAPGLDSESLAFIVIFFIAHYSLGRWSSGIEAWIGVACVLGSMVTFTIGDATANDVAVSEISLGSIAFAVGFVGGPWAAGLAVRLRRERETELKAENDRLRREQQEQAARAVAEERSRIARELHDVVSHAISVTVLQARGARATLDANPTAARRALDAIEQTNTAALGDMRRLLAVLRDTEPEGLAADDHAPQPSLAHLERLVTHVRDSGVPVEVDVVGTPQVLPPGVDLSAYRIVQEALTNVLKHTAEARARVVLEYADDALGVTVTDDGSPDAVNGAGNGSGPGGGHGLIGIQERVAVVGGEVTAGPRAGGGFEIRTRLPYSVEVS